MLQTQLDDWITDIRAVANNHNEMKMAAITTVMTTTILVILPETTDND